MNGLDVWAGYLAFDAWIANRDRHHANWGILRHLDGVICHEHGTTC
jgi:hypothetical protein